MYWTNLTVADRTELAGIDSVALASSLVLYWLSWHSHHTIPRGNPWWPHASISIVSVQLLSLWRQACKCCQNTQPLLSYACPFSLMLNRKQSLTPNLLSFKQGDFKGSCFCTICHVCQLVLLLRYLLVMLRTIPTPHTQIKLLLLLPFPFVYKRLHPVKHGKCKLVHSTNFCTEIVLAVPPIWDSLIMLIALINFLEEGQGHDAILDKCSQLLTGHQD